MTLPVGVLASFFIARARIVGSSRAGRGRRGPWRRLRRRRRPRPSRPRRRSRCADARRSVQDAFRSVCAPALSFHQDSCPSGLTTLNHLFLLCESPLRPQLSLVLSTASLAAEKFDQKAAAILLQEELRRALRSMYLLVVSCSATAIAAVVAAAACDQRRRRYGLLSIECAHGCRNARVLK